MRIMSCVRYRRGPRCSNWLAQGKSKMTRGTWSSSGNSVTTSCPRRYCVPCSSSIRLKFSKKWGAPARPDTRKHVISDRLPSVSKKMPPSKFSTSFRTGFSFFPGFCCSGFAVAAEARNNKAARAEEKNLFNKRPISIFPRNSVYSRRFCLEQKCDAVRCIQGLSAFTFLRRHFPRADGLNCGNKPWKNIGIRDRNVMCAKHQLQSRRQHRQLSYRRLVRVEIRFRPKEPDRSGIICVACEKQPVFPVEQRDGVRSVTRHRKNFQRASAEIDLEAVTDRSRNLPRFCEVSLGIESLGQIAADLVRRDFRLGVVARTSRIGPRELGIHAVDESKLPVA